MDASHVFAAQILDTLPEPEIAEIQRRQAHMSASLQKASSSLSALNEFSAVKWADLHPKFEAHTKLIKELQSDLDYVFRKIRTIKAKLNLPNMDDEEEDEEDEGNGDDGGAQVKTAEEQANASLPS
ncbi:KxDL motif-containing protein 1 [Linnemannia hyalina]|uniref:KxDL motif-containing protein 1 n=1 Tax=Linnemannia hyalina TaxID=64524 RepID=A0A9P7XU58_9FUNG|nr:KxDL motif-containing protein 1 [Linnemannia hyalina]